MRRVVPESLRPRQIPITKGQPQVIETEARAA
jgi:hypothetical protein